MILNTHAEISDGKKRHRAGIAKYNGNCTHIVGEVMGPLTYGGMVIAVVADYDSLEDKTMVQFSHVISEDTD